MGSRKRRYEVGRYGVQRGVFIGGVAPVCVSQRTSMIVGLGIAIVLRVDEEYATEHRERAGEKSHQERCFSLR